ncbi:MAG TPA: FHA domain-containing protein [Candidatus Acidoferrum sp.]|jgi:hypothetical protein|nr:FHA domain-containing protein [Candidatus Acidoferrum sp.]
MARLVVNPGSPTAWEIELKPGANSIGRGAHNDFKIPDGSVSGSHCQIHVSDQGTVIKDLGSTNGTFINRAPVQEAQLQTGQTLHLGGVPLMFYSDAPDAIAMPPPPRVGLAPPPLAPRLSVAAPPPPTGLAAPVPLPPPISAESDTSSTQPLLAGKCKHHPKIAGRFFCGHCRNFFCDLCVNSRIVGGVQHRFCRHCGAECTAAQVQAAPVTEKGFFARLPGAFAYPFRGSGLLVLIVSTFLFAGLQLLSRGLLGLFSAIVAGGYLYSYMQNIIHSTAAEDEQMPDLPGMDDIFGGFFRMAVVTILCFGPPITLGVLKLFFDMDTIPMSAIIATTALGCLYFPMAFLAVAMKDSVFAANPLVVMPAIFKVPGQYLVTALVVLSVFGVRQLGDFLMVGIKAQGYATRDMSELLIGFGIRAFWSLASIYLLTVSMRILGTLYLTNRRSFGWFDH